MQFYKWGFKKLAYLWHCWGFHIQMFKVKYIYLVWKCLMGSRWNFFLVRNWVANLLRRICKKSRIEKCSRKMNLKKPCKEFGRNSKVDVARPIGQTNDRGKFIVVVSHLFRKKAFKIKIIFTQSTNVVILKFIWSLSKVWK